MPLGRYLKDRPISGKLREQAVELFTANGATHSALVMEPFRLYVTHARDSRKWDVDGSE